MNRKPACAWLFVTLVVSVVTAAQAKGQMIEEVAQGKQVFATSCANSFCHGAEGGAGRGPRLREREWQPSYLYRTIEEGISGSAMPAWKGRLSEQQIQAVIRYILSISHEVPEATNTASAKPPQAVTVVDNASEVRGKALFFDLSRERNCAVCHRMGEAGLSVGPPIDALANRPSGAVLATILQPKAAAALDVHTASGETICGIQAGIDATTLAMYDIPSAGPPVLRTFPLKEIVSRGKCDLASPHAGLARLYSRQQLLDIVTFLESTRSQVP